MKSLELRNDFYLSGRRAIEVGKEQFECPKDLFQPLLLGMEYESLHETLFSSIMKCDVDIRKEFYVNVFLCGGNTLFSGMAARMNKELSKLLSPKHCVNIISSPERMFSV